MNERPNLLPLRKYGMPVYNDLFFLWISCYLFLGFHYLCLLVEQKIDVK